MRRVLLIVLAMAFLQADPDAPPAIAPNGVSNSASRLPLSLPGGVVAPGDPITICGVRLGSLRTSKVLVRQGALTVTAALLSVNPAEIQAILPSRLQPGEAWITVFRDSTLESRPAQIRIASSAVGLFSRNGLGWGPGVIDRVEHGGRAPVTNAHSVAPGDRIILAATGSLSPQTVIFVAGQQIRQQISHKPSAKKTGRAEITFQLPPTTPEGCYVPLWMKTGDLFSNTITVPVARSRGTCHEPEHWLPAARSSGVLWLARFSMLLELQPGDPEPSEEEQAEATFLATDHSLAVLPLQLVPPPGTCGGAAGLYEPGSGLAALFGWAFTTPGWRALSAGPEITITGPSGTTLRLPERQTGSYSLRPNRRHPAALFPPGEYRIMAPSGPSVGAFSATLRASEPLTWINRDHLGVIDRTQGATLEWRGADPTRSVLIAALSVDRASGAAFACLCHAPAGSTQFRLPPAALANLPRTHVAAGLPVSFLFILQSPAGAQAPIQAKGLDAGLALYLGGSGRTMVFR